MPFLPRAYKLPASAPPDQWSALAHGGGNVCYASGAICINIPAVAFGDSDHTLQHVLQRTIVDALYPLRKLARLLFHPHSKTAAPRKRARETFEISRQDVRRPTFYTTRYDEDRQRHSVVQQRYVFLIEELRHPQHPHAALGVRLWKVFIDPAWRETRALGLLMLDGIADAPRSPVELLHLYTSVGRDGIEPIVSDAEPWVALHSKHGDWATRTLLDADQQRVPGGLRPSGEHQERPTRFHPLSPELLLSPMRKRSLQAGLQCEVQIDPRQLDPRSYARPSAADAAAPRSETAGSSARVPSKGPSAPGPAPLRFPATAHVYGLQPHADPLESALPIDLVARLRRTAAAAAAAAAAAT